MLLLCCRTIQLCSHKQVTVFIAAINDLQVGGMCQSSFTRRLCAWYPRFTVERKWEKVRLEHAHSRLFPLSSCELGHLAPQRKPVRKQQTDPQHKHIQTSLLRAEYPHWCCLQLLSTFLFCPRFRPLTAVVLILYSFIQRSASEGCHRHIPFLFI